VLGTDCAEKWRLLYFSAKNTIAIQTYSCGGKCLEDLKNLVSSGSSRWEKIKEFAVTSIPENEARTTGIESHVESQENGISATELQNFALKLQRLYPSDDDWDESPTASKVTPAGPPAMIYM
jgi:hypothetical protein